MRKSITSKKKQERVIENVVACATVRYAASLVGIKKRGDFRIMPSDI